jgi:hypothetical protein
MTGVAEVEDERLWRAVGRASAGPNCFRTWNEAKVLDLLYKYDNTTGTIYTYF